MNPQPIFDGFLRRWRDQRHIALLLIALTAAFLTSCADSSDSATSRFSPCRIATMSTEVSCASFPVPKKRAAGRLLDNQDQSEISIRVIKLAANAPFAAPDPLWVIPGGPGQSAESIAPIMAAMAEIRKKRDILILDPRGVGDSSAIACPALQSNETNTNTLNILETATRVTRCLEELRAQNIDPLDYGTLASVEDIEDIRRALNISQMNIWAGSYGTRVALEYLRRYAEHTRTLTLDSVVSPQTTILLDGWQTRAARLREWLEACDESLACKEAIPDPTNLLSRLLKRLPREREVFLLNPKTGKKETLRIDFESALAATLPLLYLPEYAVLTPYLLSRVADEQDFAPLIAAAHMFSSNLEKGINPALYYAVTCAEDTRPRALPSTTLFTDSLRRQSFFACSSWPKARATETWGMSIVNTETPVLILSGALDPVTPPDQAREVARTLSRKKLVIAKGAGHIVSTQSCAPSLIASFVESADVARVLPSCVTHLENAPPPSVWSNVLGAEIQ